MFRFFLRKVQISTDLGLSLDAVCVSSTSSLRILLGSKSSVAFFFFFFNKEMAPAVLIISALSLINPPPPKLDFVTMR